MAVCLDYQAVYCSKRQAVVTTRLEIAIAFLLLLTLSCRVWVKISSTDLGYQLAKTRQQTIALDMERRELELELSVLLKAETLSGLARQKLGLMPLNPRQTLKVQY